VLNLPVPDEPGIALRSSHWSAGLCLRKERQAHGYCSNFPGRAEQTFIDQIITQQKGRPGELLAILEAVQERNPHKYLSSETLQYIANRLDMPPSSIYSVATFYALFNLEPQGDNTICICRGTACHTRNSRALLESLRLELGMGLDDDEAASDSDKLTLTTPDQKFTIRTVACFGQCALAPVVEINHRICGHVNERTLQREVRSLERENDCGC
jgi:NADH-quinone oxidoreductase subunit E